MTEILERLRSLMVQDVMSPSAIEVDKGASLEEAAAAMLKRPVSGVPVVDGARQCVGMLTAFDFVRAYAAVQDTQRTSVASDQFPPSQTHRATTTAAATSVGTVAGQMTSAVQSVSRSDSLLNAAAKMCREHIHRLPVLDEDGRVQGILTSLDIVAAFVNAADEQSHSPKLSQVWRENR